MLVGLYFVLFETISLHEPRLGPESPIPEITGEHDQTFPLVVFVSFFNSAGIKCRFGIC